MDHLKPAVNNPEWKLLEDYFKEAYEETKERLVKANDIDHIKELQGRATAYKEMYQLRDRVNSVDEKPIRPRFK